MLKNGVEVGRQWRIWVSSDRLQMSSYSKLSSLEEAVATHLCPLSALGLKAHAAHPLKPCRTTSALANRACVSAGQAGSTLHKMAILQVFSGFNFSLIWMSLTNIRMLSKSCAQLALALHATKPTAQAIGKTMASSKGLPVTMQRLSRWIIYAITLAYASEGLQ